MKEELSEQREILEQQEKQQQEQKEQQEKEEEEEKEEELLFHGYLGKLRWNNPELVTESDVLARTTFTSIKSHEYIDNIQVMKEKVKLLADLIRQSSNMITYTGAGISTAAGIDDYATKAKGESVTYNCNRPNIKNWRDAKPTKSHYILTALYELGYLKHWIQQNHDSLPQKAGFPQYSLNEIHGSLHDPSNPIVPYEGQLRSDLYEWMIDWKNKADLCLALGTSMSGFTADNVPISIAKRFQKGFGLGLVIINLQRTPYDYLSSLRIYGKLDDVLTLLAEELQIESKLIKPMEYIIPFNPLQSSIVSEDVFRIPYDSNGYYSTTTSQLLDLRVGSYIKLRDGPYCDDIGKCIGKTSDGHYKLYFTNSIHPVFNIRRRPFMLVLGYWWIEMMTKGILSENSLTIPIMSIERSEYNNENGNHHLDYEETKVRESSYIEGVVIIDENMRQSLLDKYLKMKKYGFEDDKLQQIMITDGLNDESLIQDMFQRITSSSSSQSKSTSPSPIKSPKTIGSTFCNIFTKRMYGTNC